MARLFITNKEKKPIIYRNYSVIRAPVCEAIRFINNKRYNDIVSIVGDHQIEVGNQVFIEVNNVKRIYANKVFTPMIYGDLNFHRQYDFLPYYVTNNEGFITEIKTCIQYGTIFDNDK